MVLNKEKLKWYDVKAKTKFVPKEFTVKVLKGRRYGLAKGPKSGLTCWRILGLAKK